jgi:hypothetical protein
MKTTTSSLPSLHVLLQLLLASAFPPLVSGWGTLGHEMVANIAWHRINNDTKEWVKDILGPQNDTDTAEAGSPLAAVADWADRVRHFMPWSAPLHYIDVRDDLYKGGCHYNNNNNNNNNSSSDGGDSDSCYFDYERDCPNDICVAGAIMNYTSQLLEAPVSKKPSSLRGDRDSWEESQALRFLTQYVRKKFWQCAWSIILYYIILYHVVWEFIF